MSRFTKILSPLLTAFVLAGTVTVAKAEEQISNIGMMKYGGKPHVTGTLNNVDMLCEVTQGKDGQFVFTGNGSSRGPAGPGRAYVMRSYGSDKRLYLLQGDDDAERDDITKSPNPQTREVASTLMNVGNRMLQIACPKVVGGYKARPKTNVP